MQQEMKNKAVTLQREKKEAMEKESTEYRNNLNVCLAKENWLALEKQFWLQMAELKMSTLEQLGLEFVLFVLSE